MKILLVANFDKDHQFSMQKFTDCLAENLVNQGYEVKICKPKSIVSFACSSTISGIAKWLGYIDKYLIFPLNLKKQARWADIIHICDHSNAIYFPYIKEYPHLVSCHDLMAVRSALGEFEKNNNIGKSGQLQQKWIVNGLRSVGYIASVSDSTQNDLKHFVDKDINNLRVIYNGLNYPFVKLPSNKAWRILNRFLLDESIPFLLHIGGNQWYKNRLGLITIYHQIVEQDPNTPFILILAGKVFSKEMRELIIRYNLSDRVIEITGATTEELMALYSLANAFIFPSLYEGFGWPIIEALACGTIVFTSNREPMNEIGGEAAIYVDPDNSEQAANIILGSLNNPLKLQEIKTKAPAIVEKFSTENMVKNYISFYEFILAQGH